MLRDRSLFLPPLFFLLAAFAIYLPALFNDYAFDGAMYMERYSEVPGISVFDALDPDRYGPSSAVLSYRPLNFAIGVAVDYKLFNATPALSHALNIILHAANASLLFLVLFSLMPEASPGIRLGAAALGGALLLVHPLASETVYCMGFRGDLLASFFVLAGLVGLLSNAPFPLRTAVTAIFFLLALFSKESGYALLFLGPLILYMRESSVRRPLIIFGVLALLLVAFGMVWLKFRYDGYASEFLGGGGRLLGMANFLVSFTEVYLRLFLSPFSLRIDHDFSAAASLGHPRVLRAVIVSLLVAVALIWSAVHSKTILVGTAFLVLGFAPVAQLTPVPDPVAERFAYFPLLGAAMIVAGGARFLPKHLDRAARLTVIFGSLLLLLLAARTHLRGWDWSDDRTLNIANWEVVENPPLRGRQALGAFYLSGFSEAAPHDADLAGRYLDAARKNLTAGLEMWPEDGELNRLMGVLILMGDADPQAAKPYAERALLTDPASRQARQLVDLVNTRLGV